MSMHTVRGDPTLPVDAETRVTTRHVGVVVEARGEWTLWWRSGWHMASKGREVSIDGEARYPSTPGPLVIARYLGGICAVRPVGCGSASLLT